LSQDLVFDHAQLHQLERKARVVRSHDRFQWPERVRPATKESPSHNHGCEGPQPSKSIMATRVDVARQSRDRTLRSRSWMLEKTRATVWILLNCRVQDRLIYFI
jgi:hypothetical protein